MIYKKKIIMLFVAPYIFALVACGKTEEEKAQEFFDSGNAYFEKGEYSAAKIQYANALQQTPDTAEILFGLVKVAEAEKKWQDLNGYLTKLLEVDENHFEGRLMYGRFVLYTNQIDKALEHSAILLEQHPDKVEVLSLAAAVQNSVGNFDEAKKIAQNAKLLEPTNVDVTMILANLEKRDGNYDLALSLLDESLSIHPDNLYLILAKVETLDNAGREAQSYAVLEQFFNKTPDSTLAGKLLAERYHRAGDREKAQSTLDKLARTSQRVYDFEESVQYKYKAEGVESALELLTSYTSEYPDVVELNLYKIHLLKESNRSNEALNLAKKLAQQNLNTDLGFAALNKQVELEFVTGAYDDAEKTINEILSGDDQNVQGLLNRARLYIFKNDPEKALIDLRKADKVELNNETTQLLLARAQIQLRNMALAGDHYNQAYSLAKQNEGIAFEYGKFLANQKSFERAESVLDPFVFANTTNVELLKLLANIKLALKKWDQAQQLAERLTSIDESESEIEKIQGLVLAGREDFEGAIAALKSYQQSLPDQTRPLVELVNTYLKAGRRADAEAFLSDILKVNQENYLAYILLGRISYYYRDFSQARVYFERAIKVDPLNIQGYRFLVQALLKEDDFSAAEQALENGIEFAEDNTYLKMLLAEVQRLSGDFDSATVTYESIIGDKPDFYVAINNLASMLSNRGDEKSISKALSYAEVFRGSEIPHFQDTLGWLYYLTGRYLDSVYMLEKAISDLADVPEVNYHLGKAYLALDRKLEAKKLLEAATSGRKFPGYEDASAELQALELEE